MPQHGPWFIKDSNDVYSDPFIHVRLDQVIRPDGDDGQHVVVLMKPGVCVLAIDDKNNVYLTREFHYGIGRYSLEAVSGGIDPGEQAFIVQEGQHVVAVLALVRRGVDLQAVAEVEQSLGTGALPYQRVEG